MQLDIRLENYSCFWADFIGPKGIRRHKYYIVTNVEQKVHILLGLFLRLLAKKSHPLLRIIEKKTRVTVTVKKVYVKQTLRTLGFLFYVCNFGNFEFLNQNTGMITESKNRGLFEAYIPTP